MVDVLIARQTLALKFFILLQYESGFAQAFEGRAKRHLIATQFIIIRSTFSSFAKAGDLICFLFENGRDIRFENTVMYLFANISFTRGILVTATLVVLTIAAKMIAPDTLCIRLIIPAFRTCEGCALR
jgi:hypothetical protein